MKITEAHSINNIPIKQAPVSFWRRALNSFCAFVKKFFVEIMPNFSIGHFPFNTVPLAPLGRRETPIIQGTIQVAKATLSPSRPRTDYLVLSSFQKAEAAIKEVKPGSRAGLNELRVAADKLKLLGDLLLIQEKIDSLLAPTDDLPLMMFSVDENAQLGRISEDLNSKAASISKKQMKEELAENFDLKSPRTQALITYCKGKLTKEELEEVKKSIGSGNTHFTN